MLYYLASWLHPKSDAACKISETLERYRYVTRMTCDVYTQLNIDLNHGCTLGVMFHNGLSLVPIAKILAGMLSHNALVCMSLCAKRQVCQLGVNHFDKLSRVRTRE